MTSPTVGSTVRRAFGERGGAAIRALTEHGADGRTERLAETAGVARAQLYKHFTDATNPRCAIPERVSTWVHADLAPVRELRGTPREGAGAPSGRTGDGWPNTATSPATSPFTRAPAGIRSSTYGRRSRDISPGCSSIVSGVCGGDTRVAESVAHGVAGLVESSTVRWLENADRIPRAELTALLVRWAWRILDDVFRAGGAHLDPDAPVADAAPPPPL